MQHGDVAPALQAFRLDFILSNHYYSAKPFVIPKLQGGIMRGIAQTRKQIGKPIIVSVLLLVVILTAQTGFTASERKGSRIVTSREATEIWHSYEINPNYNYYYSGPNSQPNYIIGIDNKYEFTSKKWKPVDLTPEMLKKWFNFIKPRVGYSLDTYGAFITGPNGERLGMWYSVKDWRLGGSASVNENNQVSVTAPAIPGGSRGGIGGNYTF